MQIGIVRHGAIRTYRNLYVILITRGGPHFAGNRGAVLKHAQVYY
jgi:hypothetical protein